MKILLNFTLHLTTVAFIFVTFYPKYSYPQRNIDPEIKRIIDEYIESTFHPASRTTGLGVAVVLNDGEVLYTTGYGKADIGKDIPVENSTQFIIGSVSKTFTAVLAVKVLHEAFPELGEAVLDTPIKKLLPHANLTLIDRYRSEQATFRDLLAHRLCVAGNDIQILSGQIESDEELIYRARYNPEICRIRTGLAYNNQMISIAGELSGFIVNKTYDEAMQDLWNDLGMHNTEFVKETDDYSQMPYRAMPYYFRDDQFHMPNPNLLKRVAVDRASGGICSTPDDMSKFMRLYINNGNVDGKQIIASEAMEWLTKQSGFYGAFGFKNSDQDFILNSFGYGLAVQVSALDGWKYVHHAGYTVPYANYLSLGPDQRIGIFSTSNTGPMITDHFGLHGFIFETLRGSMNAKERAEQFAEQMTAQEEKKLEQKRAIAQSDFEKYKKLASSNKLTNQVEVVGQYGSGMSGELEISEKFNEATNQTQYYFSYGKWYTGWLRQDGENVFKILWDTDVYQDNYLIGASADDWGYLIIENDILHFSGTFGYGGTFQRNINLDILPTIPWTSDSC